MIILGFLIGGASVNVAVLSCIVACQLIYWGCIVKKQIKYSIVCGIPVITGSALNVLSPGNYRTDSTVTSTDKFLEVFKGSAIYEYERIKMFITEYPLFITVILIFIILFLISDSKYTYSFPVPLIYTILLVLGELATIFPTQWASGVEAYAVYERCIIISDWTSFLLIFLIVFYWTGWIKVRFNIEGISSGKTRVSICMAVLCIFGIVSFMQGDKNASYRLAHELKDGHVQEYCKWVESIIHEVESSDEQIVEIHTKEVKDTTCMANAFFNIGIYDPDTYVGNSAMGNFYGKKAVYIIDEE
ncbi:MAG: hypothetical protein IKQ44_05050 [Lachnospiraceae bacterium]|nr:hypothetical protein [Lachnospiraceae bacterium]